MIQNSIRHRLSAACALLQTSFEMILNSAGSREDANELHRLGIDKVLKILSDLDEMGNEDDENPQKQKAKPSREGKADDG